MPNTIKELIEAGKKASGGEWMPGHLSDDESSCNCPYVLCDGYMGSICSISVDNGKCTSEGGNDSPPLEEAKANQKFIALAANARPAIIQMQEQNERMKLALMTIAYGNFEHLSGLIATKQYLQDTARQALNEQEKG